MKRISPDTKIWVCAEKNWELKDLDRDEKALAVNAQGAEFYLLGLRMILQVLL